MGQRWSELSATLRLEGVISLGLCVLLLVLHALQLRAERQRKARHIALGGVQHPRDGYIPHRMRQLLPLVTLMLALRLSRLFSSGVVAYVIFEFASNNATVGSMVVVFIFAWGLARGHQRVLAITCAPKGLIYSSGALFVLIGNGTVLARVLTDRNWHHAIFLLALAVYATVAVILAWLWVFRVNAAIDRLKRGQTVEGGTRVRPVVVAVQTDAHDTQQRRGSVFDLERKPFPVLEVESSESRRRYLDMENSGSQRTSTLSDELHADELYLSDDPPSMSYSLGGVNEASASDSADRAPQPADSGAGGSWSGYSTMNDMRLGDGRPAVALQTRAQGAAGSRHHRDSHNEEQEEQEDHEDEVERRIGQSAVGINDPAAAVFPSRRRRGPLARMVGFLFVATAITVCMVFFLVHVALSVYLSDIHDPFWTHRVEDPSDVSNAGDVVLFCMRFLWVVLLTFYSWGPVSDACRGGQRGTLTYDYEDDGVDSSLPLHTDPDVGEGVNDNLHYRQLPGGLPNEA